MQIKVATILGARPQFIKAAAVSRAIAEQQHMVESIIHTGQHHDGNMSDVFFQELEIPVPSHHLGIHGGGHGAMTGKMLLALEEVFQADRPDVVLVYGDTNSTLAGALAAVKLHIPVAHVESGLRSFNLRMPEEVNRILTDRVSSWLFTPTDEATKNLVREGVERKAISQVGDVMYDVALHHGARVSSEGRVLSAVGLKPGEYILATIHRAENTDDPACLNAIADAFMELGRQVPLLWPLHPRTRSVLERLGRLKNIEKQLKIVEPLGYLDMVQAEKYAAVVVTDSGGVQKEAFFHQVPCVTLREETEWVELVESGWNHLVSVKQGGVAKAALAAIGSRGSGCAPYGDGRASKKIVDVLENIKG